MHPAPDFGAHEETFIAIIRCPHGYRFTIRDQCPETLQPARKVPPPSRLSIWWATRKARKQLDRL